MRIFRGFDNLPLFKKGVATMGSFDGLHGGHLELLRRVKSVAKECCGESVVLTFEPHPRYVLGTGDGLYLLSTLEEKIHLLEQAGIDNVIIIPFTIEFSKTSREEFISRNIAAIGIETLVVGYNHRFGHNKQGDYNFLESQGSNLKIHLVEQQQMQQSKVSSTIIRKTIEQGDIHHATKLLSHPYIIICSVNDKGLADDIEPTKLLPPEGQYTVTIDGKQAVMEITKRRSLKICNWENRDANIDKVIIEVNSINII